MKVTRIFAGEDGRSHFEDLRIPLAGTEASDTLATVLPAVTATVLASPAGTVIDLHTAPRRQLVIHLSGRCELDCADGTRRFGPGDVLLGDDMESEGHVTRMLDDLSVLILAIPPDFDISEWRLPA
jgi:hypothetical protein